MIGVEVMLNETQRNFRKQMRELNKERALHIDYKQRTVKFVKRISIIGVILIVFRIIIISSWLMNLFTPMLTTLGIDENNKVIASMKKVDSAIFGENQEHIANYLEKVESKEKVVNESIGVALVMSTDPTDDINEKVIGVRNKLVEIKNIDVVKEGELQELSSLLINKIEITQELLDYCNSIYKKETLKIDNPIEDINKYINNINIIENKIHEEIIKLLEENNINYQIGKDRSISYQYNRRITKEISQKLNEVFKVFKTK